MLSNSVGILLGVGAIFDTSGIGADGAGIDNLHSCKT
jgi:hypothetical protein